MVVLLTGATGFIGRALAAALRARGHRVIAAVRDIDAARAMNPDMHFVHADFARDLDPEAWLPRLAGVDAVVNAVGILRERPGQTFAALHERGPQALFAACARLGIGRVVQVSALGADDLAQSGYHRSKKAADDYLLAHCADAVVAQPSVVYGPGGTSARLFALLASLPLVPLPGAGDQSVQPIHRGDLVDALVALVEAERRPDARVPLVGPTPLTLREFLQRLRQAMRLPATGFLSVPLPLMRLGARLGGVVAGSLLDRETLAMLERGNTADPAATTELLGRPPRPVAAFISAGEAEDIVTRARLAWLLPLLRLSVAFVWLAAGAVSLGLYPAADSYALLARTGLTGALAPVALYGAAALDLALGIAILVRRSRTLWLVQIAIVLAYTAIITWALPEFWLHPYGPLVKNVPLLAALWLLYEFEDR